MTDYVLTNAQRLRHVAGIDIPQHDRGQHLISLTAVRCQHTIYPALIVRQGFGFGVRLKFVVLDALKTVLVDAQAVKHLLIGRQVCQRICGSAAVLRHYRFKMAACRCQHGSPSPPGLTRRLSVNYSPPAAASAQVMFSIRQP